ncbi:MAG: FtsQ-type POTRA domain-containing protein [Patescibacteria group bacterium]|nr:FtsQ-type POTRA domain-containing protein [Patescibacteria group bacterium]
MSFGKNILGQRRFRVNRKLRARRPFRIKANFLKFTFFNIINSVLLLVIIFGVYFFLFSGFYKISNIEIQGNQIISTDDILDITNNYLSGRTLLIFSNKNIFIFSKNELKRRIGEYVLLNDLKIDRVLPNTIKIELQEKEAAIKWITNDQEYLVDKNGIVIKKFYKLVMPKIFQLNTNSQPDETKETIPDSFLKVLNTSNQNINLGDKVLLPENVDFIFQLQEKFSQKDYLKIKNITVPNNMPKFITANLDSGWYIMLNLSDTADNQYNRLELLIDEKIKRSNLNRLDYVDLRLGESVYYKFK